MAKCLEASLGRDRGRFFTVSGNHDGEPKDWEPGEFTRKYVNPLGEEAYVQTSRFSRSQRPDEPDFRQLTDYPGTRWDRYLVRTGNVIWIMLGDRNEFDNLALSRGDLSGTFQAGRGSAAGMPRGGYPSGSVTLDTFYWWKKVVEDPEFSNDILITAHHHMPAHTTITTDDGEPGNYHGKSGSMGPHGETGGQLYWIREYNQKGEEINQYAQTRPFLNYLQDHPGAIAAWIGGHTHIHTPESSVNGRGPHVRKYGVTFISIGALTDSHAGGLNQMTRMLTFREGTDEALLNVYIHRSKDGHAIGWVPETAWAVPLGKKFICPASAKNGKGPAIVSGPHLVPPAPEDPVKPRYRWDFNHDKAYDFNSDKFVVGEDGSPYGTYEGPGKIRYSEDTPSGKGRSLDLRDTQSRIVFNAPYTPEMNWRSATISLQLKMQAQTPQEILSCGAEGPTGKFRLWYDGAALIWEVGEGRRVRRTKSKVKQPLPGEWWSVTGIVDGVRQRIRLYINDTLAAESKWKGKSMNQDPAYRLVLGHSSEQNSLVRPFDGLVDEIVIHDKVVLPQ